MHCLCEIKAGKEHPKDNFNTDGGGKYEHQYLIIMLIKTGKIVHGAKVQ